MGYYMSLQNSSFCIPQTNFQAALDAIKNLAGKGDFAWVNPQFTKCLTLDTAMLCWRWELIIGETGDVDEIVFCGEKLGADDILFTALAPFVTPGSFIEMRGEDGAFWKWCFDGVNLETKEGKVVY